MTTTIWKATLQPHDENMVMVPAGAKMLCAREQHDHICVWYRCDPSAPLTPRVLSIVGTGHTSSGANGRYLGSASLMGGQLIFHVFERVS